MVLLSSEDNERAVHLNSIKVLANELQRTTEEVSLIYTSVLEDIQKEARVKIFLHILASRKVKELMRH